MGKLISLQIAIACLSGLQQGYNLCFIGSLLAALQRSLEWCYPCAGGIVNVSHCNCPEKQLAVSIISIGAVVGGVSAGAVSDIIGRRPTLLALALIFACGTGLMVSAGKESTELFYLGRLVSGIAVGGSGQASVYIAEIAPLGRRGALVSLNELALGIGCLAAALAAQLIGDERWRVTIGLGGVIAMLQVVGIACALQESPGWLLEQGQVAQAIRGAKAIGLDLGSTSVECGGHRSEGKSFCSAAMAHRGALLLALCCGLAHAATATNTVLYYSRNILRRSGFERALLATVFVDGLKLVGIAIGIMLVDKVGRRPLLTVGTLGIILGHLGLSVAFAMNSEEADVTTRLALPSLCLFILAWNVSWSGLMLTVASELLPQSLRGVGLGLVYSIYWLVSGAEEQTIERLFDDYGESATFGFYGLCSLGTLLFVRVFLPETRGTSLEASEYHYTFPDDIDDFGFSSGFSSDGSCASL